MKTSAKSLRAFIRFLLAIERTDFCYHQTLTVRENLTDQSVARARLETFLKAIHKRYKDCDCASIHVQEEQSRGAIHFHLLFLFFKTPPFRDAEELHQIVFKTWQRVNPHKLHAAANQTLHRPKDALNRWVYLIEEIELGKRSRTAPRWWTVRAKKLLAAHSRTNVSKDEVEKVFRRWLREKAPMLAPLPVGPLPRKGRRPVYDDKFYESLKVYLETQGKYDIEDFKRLRTGRKGKVSKRDFLEFLNQERSAK